MKNPNQGFTLVEILVVLALFSIVAVAMTGVVLRVMREGQRAQMKILLNQHAQRVFDDLGYEIRRASCVRNDPPNEFSSDQIITTYSDSNCAGTPTVIYEFSGGSLTKNGQSLLPDEYGICTCSSCGVYTLVQPQGGGVGDMTRSDGAQVSIQLRPRSSAYNNSNETCVRLNGIFVPRN